MIMKVEKLVGDFVRLRPTADAGGVFDEDCGGFSQKILVGEFINCVTVIDENYVKAGLGN